MCIRDRRWDVQPDTITYYTLENPMTIYDINGETQYTARVTEPIVNTEKLETRDKYAAFLDWNNGYSVIEGDGEGSILVVKDSYANCFVPFLTVNYAKIGGVEDVYKRQVCAHPKSRCLNTCLPMKASIC